MKNTVEVLRQYLFKWRRESIDIKEVLDLILRYSTLFFSAGMASDMFFYITGGKDGIALMNGITIALILIIFILYRKRLLNADKGILLNTIVTSLNLCLSMIMESYVYAIGSQEHIIIAVCVYVITVMLAGMTSFRMMPALITAGAIISYILSALHLDDPLLMRMTPTVILVLMGTGVISANLFSLARRIERHNMKVVHEQEMLIRFFNFEPKLWQKIKEGLLTREQYLELFRSMEKSAQDKLIFRLKDIVHSEYEIKSLLKEEFRDITSGELQLCCLITYGHSVTEIAKIRGVSISTVTSMRSRLRTKLGLGKHENLREYLQTVIHKGSAV